MKKIVISGSAKLFDKVKYWVEYFEKNGYKVLDYPKYIGKPEETEDYEACMIKIYKEYYHNLEQTDVFFLMNEEKNGIDGYVGPSAMSELTYVIIQNLIHNKKVDIYILKEPSKELNCYDEIKFWFNKGLIKIWKEENNNISR